MASHRSDFRMSLYTANTTLSPGAWTIALVEQDRAYRFKQIWAYVDVDDFGAGGALQAFLRFYQGKPPLNVLSNINTVATNNNLFQKSGLMVAECPIGKCTNPVNGTNTLEFGHHDTLNFQWRLSGYAYEVVRPAGFSTVSQSFDLEVVCDYMTLEVYWDTNIFNPAPGLLASIGSTHPSRMYHDFNFSPI